MRRENPDHDHVEYETRYDKAKKMNPKALDKAVGNPAWNAKEHDMGVDREINKILNKK